MDITNILQMASYEGLVFGLVAIGVYITFRVLAFPDLSVDGTFPLGGAVAAVLIAEHESDPFVATLAALGVGMLAGFCTGFLNTKLRISALLSGILMMVGLYSVNLRIMDGANKPFLRDQTVFDHFEDWLSVDGLNLIIITMMIIVGLVFAALNWFLRTDLGLALRATGDNEQMVRGMGGSTDVTVLLGCALSNGLVAMAGALFVQNQKFSDVGIGFGIIVIGLASVIIGEALLRPRGILRVLLACLVGAFFYRLLIQIALRVDWLEPGDLKLITVVLLILLLALPYIKKRIRGEWIPPAERM